MPVIEGGQVLRGGQDFGGVLGGQVLYGGQEIEPEQGGRTQPDSEAVEMSVGPFRRDGAPPNGWYNGVADKGAIAVDITTGTHYANTGTKAATVWTPDAPSGGGSGLLSVDVPISEAELQNLHAVTKTLVPAPGLNHMVEPVQITIERLAGTAYTVPGGNFFEFGYPDGVAGQALVSFDPTRLLGSFSGGARGFVQLAPSVGSNYWANPDTIVNTFDDKANQPFGVALDSAVTDGTGGVIMHVLYRVL